MGPLRHGTHSRDFVHLTKMNLSIREAKSLRGTSIYACWRGDHSHTIYRRTASGHGKTLRNQDDCSFSISHVQRSRYPISRIPYFDMCSWSKTLVQLWKSCFEIHSSCLIMDWNWFSSFNCWLINGSRPSYDGSRPSYDAYLTMNRSTHPRLDQTILIVK